MRAQVGGAGPGRRAARRRAARLHGVASYPGRVTAYRIGGQRPAGRRTGAAALAVVVAAVGVGVAAVVTLGAYIAHPLAVPLAILGVAFVAVAASRPAWALSLALLAVPLELINLPIGSGALSPSEAMVALVALAWLGRLALGRPGTALPERRDLPILVLLLAAAAGLAIARDPAPVVRTVALWGLFFTVYLATRSFSLAEVRLVVVSFLLGAGVLGALGAGQYLGSGQTGVMAGGEVTAERAVGTFADPNYFAALLLLALLPGLAFLLSDWRRLVVLLVPAAGTLAGVVFSLSRGGLLGLAAGLLVLALWKRGRRALLITAVAAGLWTAVAPSSDDSPGVLSVVGERIATLGGGQSLVQNRRPEIWRRAIEITQEHPVLGVGLNQFSSEAAARSLFERGGPLENAHSLPLSLAAEIGLIGLMAFLTFLAQLFVRSIRALGYLSGRARGLMFGLLAALVAFSVQSFTVVPIRTPVVMAAFLVVAGLTTNLHDRGRRSRETTPLSPLSE